VRSNSAAKHCLKPTKTEKHMLVGHAASQQ
jgi:hypothetical protein